MAVCHLAFGSGSSGVGGGGHPVHSQRILALHQALHVLDAHGHVVSVGTQKRDRSCQLGLASIQQVGKVSLGAMLQNGLLNRCPGTLGHATTELNLLAADAPAAVKPSWLGFPLLARLLAIAGCRFPVCGLVCNILARQSPGHMLYSTNIAR